MDSSPLIFEPDFQSSSVLAYLDHKYAYSPERSQQYSYIIWDRRELEHRLPSLDELNALSNEQGSPVLILGAPLNGVQESNLHLHLLAKFDTSFCNCEKYFIYR